MEGKVVNENFNEFGGVARIGTVAKNLIENYEMALNAKDGVIGIRTGFEQLDAIIQGFQRKNLILLCGRPGIGKTSFIVNVSNNICKNNHSILYFSLGLSTAQLAKRVLANTCEFPNSIFESGKLSDKVIGKIEEVSKRDFYIYENVKITLSELKSQCIKLKQANKLDLVIIDDLQSISFNDNRLRLGRYSYKDEEWDKLSLELKSFARDLDVPIVVITQFFNREEDKSIFKPDDSDTLNILVQDSDVVLFMLQNTLNENQNYIDLHIIKNLNGNTNIIKYKYNNNNSEFIEEKYH